MFWINPDCSNPFFRFDVIIAFLGSYVAPDYVEPCLALLLLSSSSSLSLSFWAAAAVLLVSVLAFLCSR